MAHYTSSLEIPIPDRVAAGQALAGLLDGYRERSDAIVLALPRGGVPVGYEIAMALNVRLDLMLVRKLGVPGHAELAMGAIASGGVRVLNHDVIRALGIGAAAVEAVASQEAHELLRRDQAYRAGRPVPELQGQLVVLVDDGIATGATMRAAVQAVRQQGAAHIVVAAPVAPPDTLAQLRAEAVEVVCPFAPDDLIAIGRWYRDFTQVPDQHVIELLQRAWQRECEQTAGGKSDASL